MTECLAGCGDQTANGVCPACVERLLAWFARPRSAVTGRAGEGASEPEQASGRGQ